jgi:acyl-CoA thioesterase YciA
MDSRALIALRSRSAIFLQLRCHGGLQEAVRFDALPPESSSVWQIRIRIAPPHDSRTLMTEKNETGKLMLPSTMPALRVMPMPSDANIHGDVFGGWIMAQVDIAGSLPAVKRAGGRVATVAVNSFVFRNPVLVGDLLSFYSKIVKVGTTSITVFVEVFAERNRLDAEVVKVTEATLTYVATDNDRKPRQLPVIE